MKEITVKTRSRCEIVDITQQINAALPAFLTLGYRFLNAHARSSIASR